MPSTIYNHDIAGAVRRLDRFCIELQKSVSSNTSQMNAFDQERLVNYLNALIQYHNFVVGSPALDLPESHPMEYIIPDPPELPLVENEGTNDIIRLMLLARTEILNSQSARDPASLNPFDSKRFLAIVGKVDAFLKTYISSVTPLDLPESSPSRAMSGKGDVGV